MMYHQLKKLIQIFIYYIVYVTTITFIPFKFVYSGLILLGILHKVMMEEQCQ